jgi:hypothetical protein
MIKGFYKLEGELWWHKYDTFEKYLASHEELKTKQIGQFELGAIVEVLEASKVRFGEHYTKVIYNGGIVIIPNIYLPGSQWAKYLGPNNHKLSKLFYR